MKFSKILFLILLVSSYCVSSAYSQSSLTAKKLLFIAEQTEGVRAFYGMNDGKLYNCIEQSVDRVDENDFKNNLGLWKISFYVGKTCGYDLLIPIKIFVFIDANGNVVGSEPSDKYFKDPLYCKKDDDCFSIDKNNSRVCINYALGQFDGKISKDEECACLNYRCEYLMPSEDP